MVIFDNDGYFHEVRTDRKDWKWFSMMAERVDHSVTKWCKIGGLILLGWFSSSAYHGTLSASKAVKAVPVLQAQAGCEHYLARKNKEVAKQAISAANSDDLPIPSPQALPQDKCPHPAK